MYVMYLSRWLFSMVHVSECEKIGDSPHEDVLFLTKKHDLIIQERKETFQSVRVDLTFSSPKAGPVSFMYLLTGSDIEYTLCLGSHKSFEQKGTLFLFDDYDNYWHYLNSPEQGEQLSIFLEDISIGKNNESRCITVRYRTLKDSYYFIASRTPGPLFYSFNYTNTVKYYNTSSYSASCNINLTPCTLSIPGHIFSTEEYVLLAHIVPNEYVASAQTHLCATTVKSDTITLIEVLLGSVAGIAGLAVSLIIFVASVMTWRNRNRKGYHPINRVSINAEYQDY